MVRKGHTAWFAGDDTKQHRDRHQAVGQARRKDNWKATVYEQ